MGLTSVTTILAPMPCAREATPRPHHPVYRTLTRTISIIKQVLGIGIIDRQHREAQYTSLLHTAQANDAGSRLFHTTDDCRNQFGARCVKSRDKITAIVHRHVRLMVKHGIDMAV